MMENKISVIVLAYNNEDTIFSTLTSIVKQRCRLPVEIVIGDDCSTDGTRRICQDFQQSFPGRIRLICNDHRKGIIDNYYDCLMACEGSLIADCAADDFWTSPYKLDDQLDLLDEYPEATMVHTNWEYYDTATNTTHPSEPQPFNQPITDGKDMLEALLCQTRGILVHSCTMLYRKECFLKAYEEDPQLFRNKEFMCEDLQLIFTLARMGKVAYSKYVGLNYRYNSKHNASMPEDEEEAFKFSKGVSQLTFYLSEKYGIKSRRTRKAFQQRLFALQMHAFRAYSPALRDEAAACAKAWHVQQQPRHRIAWLVMHYKILWRIFLVLRQLFIGAKRVFYSVKRVPTIIKHFLSPF